MARHLSLVSYAPDNHLEGFFVSRAGAFSVVWEVQNGPWHRPVALTAPRLRRAGLLSGGRVLAPCRACAASRCCWSMRKGRST